MQVESAAFLKPPVGAVLIWFGFWLALGSIAVWSVLHWRRKRRLADKHARANVGKL